MIELRPYKDLGGASHGWLDTRHHFSFADYRDPERGLELGELMCLDALERRESCGGHFREEYQTADGEALRDDEHVRERRLAPARLDRDGG